MTPRIQAQTTPGWSFPTYPLFVPARPSKSSWRPYGRIAPPILPLGGAGRYSQPAPAPARAIDHESGDNT
jgi:hypothetical protein